MPQRIVQMKFWFENNQNRTSSVQAMDVENLIRKFQEQINTICLSN